MFDETFRVCFADNPLGVVLHQRIRYQVFCLDKGFENPAAFSSAEEVDAWDERSAHFIVQNKETGQWVAATRLVLPGKEPDLPVDRLDALDRSRLPDPEAPLAEISRFCIIGNRSQVEPNDRDDLDPQSLAAWGIGAVGKPQQFEVTLGMIRVFAIFALKRKINWCVLLITDAFARLLRKLGVTLHQVGPVVEFRGHRTTYLVNVRESVSSMSQKSSAIRDLYRRSRYAYVRLSAVMADDNVDHVSEFSPDHSLFNETIFRESVLQPAEEDSGLSMSPVELARAVGRR